MSVIPGLHNLKLVQLSIGGVPISGYGEEGGIEFEFGSTVTETTVGADGHSVTSVNNDDSMRVRITLQPTTRAYGLMFQLYRTQRTAMNTVGRVPPMPFLMVAPNGDKVDEPFAIFEELPPPSQARTAGERVFTLFLPTARQRAVLGGATLL